MSSAIVFIFGLCEGWGRRPPSEPISREDIQAFSPTVVHLEEEKPSRFQPGRLQLEPLPALPTVG